MPGEKKKESVFIKKDCLYTSGISGARQFKVGEKIDIITGQKEDFTKNGISPNFVKILKFHKHI